MSVGTSDLRTTSLDYSEEQPLRIDERVELTRLPGGPVTRQCERIPGPWLDFYQ